MKITTKLGDHGCSFLYDGEKGKKSDLYFEILGEIDELSSFLGLVKSEIDELVYKSNTQKDEKLVFLLQTLQRVQDDLYRIMSFVGFKGRYPNKILAISLKDIEYLEKIIEDKKKNLNEVKEFVRPGNGKISSLLHICRCVCRRAERAFVRKFFIKNGEDFHLENLRQVKCGKIVNEKLANLENENVLNENLANLEDENVEKKKHLFEKETSFCGKTEAIYLNRLSDMIFVLALMLEDKNVL